MKTYIITDPCYIMNEEQYDNICKQECCDFEGQEFPLASKHRETGEDIVIYTIKETPNGDGGYKYKGQKIGVDAGMLCIARCDTGWEHELLGATFDTLAEAKSAFPQILEQF